MEELLAWAVRELMIPHPLRRNQIVGEINHAGRLAVDFMFLDYDRPERGAVELLQIQLSSNPQQPHSNQLAYTCRVYKLMELASAYTPPDQQESVLFFSTTQAVIHWLQTDEYTLSD